MFLRNWSLFASTVTYVVYTYVYRADMKLKGHRNLSDIQYHKLPLLLESNIWGRVAAPVKTRAGSYQLE